MSSFQLRQLFLDFFKKNGHAIVPSSSLLPTDPSVLFTTAGMQQFKEYYLGKPSPYGKNTASCQKSLRTSDIDEVGDESHLTFFEMLGNFSFGGYFKKESIRLAYDFVAKELGLEIDYVTIFDPAKVEKGDWRASVPRDDDSYNIWKEEIGLPEDKIRNEGTDNFWGPTGNEGPCGPTTEIYVKSVEGQSIEIWNIVFNEYFCDQQKKLTKLENSGVDTGMGLERLAMIVQEKPSIFETDLFESIIKEVERNSQLSYKGQERLFRIISDHIKSSVFIASEGVLPSNVERGYILRRLLRRIIRYGKFLNLKKNYLQDFARAAVEIYKETYPEIKARENEIFVVFQKEEEKFEKTLDAGIIDTVSVVADPEFSGKKAYNWYATSGVPFDIIKEIAQERGIKIDKAFEIDFEKEKEKHKEISRAGVEGKFGGVGKDANQESAKLHTATHLLHQALREILGNNVKQMGSDITPQRLRFDFSHSAKMTIEEIKKVEELVNQKIKENLEVKKEEMIYEEAIKSGALAFFKEKYPEKVSVFSIIDSNGAVFSKEICAGPHAKTTGELGKLKILKEESSGAGIRRIKAILELL